LAVRNFLEYAVRGGFVLPQVPKNRDLGHPAPGCIY